MTRWEKIVITENQHIEKFINYISIKGIYPKDSSQIVPTDNFKSLASTDDKGSKRSISYWFKIEHDFAYGYINDFKQGRSARFTSYDKDMFPADITRVNKTIKANKLKAEKEAKERSKKVTERTLFHWPKLKSTGTTK